MSSPANITIINNTSLKLLTKVTNQHWIEDDGRNIDGKVIAPKSQEAFKEVAKTGHSGQITFQLIDSEFDVIGELEIKSLKDPQDEKNLVTTSYNGKIKLVAKGERHSEEDKDLRQITLEVFYNNPRK
ncbi:hypothetical protein [Aureivirga marina]|uniref:hypothetical protein n=1 Tax=Aureivirga marina TaxID=1182451 RepID=UPI0018CB8470|nr:hypothetical protein [Aureivirga marina]